MILHYVLEFTRVDTNTAVLHLTSLFYRILKNEETTRRVRCYIFSSSIDGERNEARGWMVDVCDAMIRWKVLFYYFSVCFLFVVERRDSWVVVGKTFECTAMIVFRLDHVLTTNKRFQHARVSNNGVKVNMKFQTLGWLIFFLLKGENTVLKRCHRLLFRLAFASFSIEKYPWMKMKGSSRTHSRLLKRPNKEIAKWIKFHCN